MSDGGQREAEHGSGGQGDEYRDPPGTEAVEPGCHLMRYGWEGPERHEEPERGPGEGRRGVQMSPTASGVFVHRLPETRTAVGHGPRSRGPASTISASLGDESEGIGQRLKVA